MRNPIFAVAKVHSEQKKKKPLSGAQTLQLLLEKGEGETAGPYPPRREEEICPDV